MQPKHFLVILALAVVTQGASAMPARFDAGKIVAPPSAAAQAAADLAAIERVLKQHVVLACTKCKSSLSLLLIGEVLDQQPPPVGSPYDEARKLRDEGQALFNEKKYDQALPVLQKAKVLLNLDAPQDDSAAADAVGVSQQ